MRFSEMNHRSDKVLRGHGSRALIITALLLLFSPDTSFSHPHVFIQNTLRIVFDQEGLAGVQVSWVFDEFFSSMIADEFDRNHNNTFEEYEIYAVKKGAFANLAKFDYFSFIKIGGKPFKVSYIRDFTAALEGGKLIYKFMIPCHVTAGITFKEIIISHYDPTYYSRVVFAKDKPVILEGALDFEVNWRISKNLKEAYYYGQVHPVEVIVRFKRRYE
jgi:ABC-type uncharacterized transport system substrate-binding protein